MSIMNITNEQIRKFLDTPIRHPKFNDCMLYITTAYKSTFSYPISIYIVADSGLGKTVLADTCIAKINETIVYDNTRRQYPAIKITLKSGALPREVIKEILKKLNVPSTGHGKKDLKLLFETQLKECAVRVIFIDEFHNLLRHNDKSVNIKAAQFIKELIENHGIAVILLGTKRGEKLFELSEELRTRFTPANELTLMSCKTKDEKKYFQDYISRYLAQSPIKFPNLSDENNIYRLELAGGGNLRRMRYIFQYALLNHTAKGDISMEELQTAFTLTKEKYIKNKKGEIIKPFLDDMAIIKGALGYA